MAGKYFYKGYDINDMIQTGTQNIPGYTNFPKYIKTSGTYGTSDTVKDGFANVYFDVSGDFSNKLIAAASTKVTNKGSISIPPWCNAVKIKLVTAKGLKGDTGEAGQGGDTGTDSSGNGSNGANGDKGSDSKCDVGGGTGGPGGPGGYAGGAGKGGDGGDGGAGGDGGDGGDGMITYSNVVYNIDTNYTINVDISNVDISKNKLNFSIKKSNNQEVFKVELISGSKGIKGASGLKGAKGANGEKGGDGAKGYRGGDAGCGQQNPDWQALKYGRNGGSGARGDNGAKGATGAKGAKGATGATGTKGEKGTSATGTIVYATQNAPDVSLNTVPTTELSETSATVYFFAL
jgi:hypothetical protein